MRRARSINVTTCLIAFSPLLPAVIVSRISTSLLSRKGSLTDAVYRGLEQGFYPILETVRTLFMRYRNAQINLKCTDRLKIKQPKLLLWQHTSICTTNIHIYIRKGKISLVSISIYTPNVIKNKYVKREPAYSRRVVNHSTKHHKDNPSKT